MLKLKSSIPLLELFYGETKMPLFIGSCLFCDWVPFPFLDYRKHSISPLTPPSVHGNEIIIYCYKFIFKILERELIWALIFLSFCTPHQNFNYLPATLHHFLWMLKLTSRWGHGLDMRSGEITVRYENVCVF